MLKSKSTWINSMTCIHASPTKRDLPEQFLNVKMCASPVSYRTFHVFESSKKPQIHRKVSSGSCINIGGSAPYINPRLWGSGRRRSLPFAGSIHLSYLPILDFALQSYRGFRVFPDSMNTKVSFSLVFMELVLVSAVWENLSFKR